jgi:hypothetical protein
MTVNVEDALQALEEDKNERARICMEEINEVLSKYKCIMEPEVTLVSNTINSRIIIIAQ